VTSEPSAEAVLERYPAQYIPTSVFVGVDGAVVDTVAGPLTESELQARLDALAE
jgi:thioredoxin-like negative regulator of GroEL